MQTLGEKLTKKDTLALADQRRNYLSNVALTGRHCRRRQRRGDPEGL